MPSAQDVKDGVIAATPLVGTGLSALLSAREAQKNRNFQERMSSTAHQREVSDLKAAGLNPALSAMRGAGASTPGGSTGQVGDLGEAASRGISSALALRRVKSEINLLDAQTAAANAAGQESNARATDLLATRAGRVDLGTAEAAIASRNLAQMKEMFPVALAKARAEIEGTMSTAQAARMRALLDSLSIPGARNDAEFQQFIGQAGPWGKVLAGMVKLGVAGAAAGAVMQRSKYVPRGFIRRK